MPIQFTCPRCGKTSDVADQYAGQSGPCVHCGKTITVPLPAGRRRPKRGPWASLVMVILCLLGLAILVPLALLAPLAFQFYVIEPARANARRDTCVNHLKEIGLALHNYHDAKKHFPPAVLYGPDGKTPYSWRVALLPYLGETQLFNQYRFDEPWNGPHNLALAARMPEEYRCPRDPRPTTAGITSYAMLVGPHAASDGPTGRRLADITDGPDKTIMVVEVVGAGINWMEPRDLDVEKMTFHIVHPGEKPTRKVTDISSAHPTVANVLFCNGIVLSLPDDIDPKLLEAMTTIDGGEAVNLGDWSQPPKQQAEKAGGP
jgi:hypothetical protein